MRIGPVLTLQTKHGRLDRTSSTSQWESSFRIQGLIETHLSSRRLRVLGGGRHQRRNVSAVAVASSEDSEESCCILGTTIFASIVDQVVSGAPQFTEMQAT